MQRLNDSLGHDAGDAALLHLTTPIKDSGKTLTRLQRELTKRFFLHNNEKQLITFSAGVTELRADDIQTSVIKRADEAMYEAKQTGKNRVVVG